MTLQTRINNALTTLSIVLESLSEELPEEERDQFKNAVLYKLRMKMTMKGEEYETRPQAS